MNTPIETTAEHRHHGGTLGYYRHASAACVCDMNFSVFVPPQAAEGAVPAVYWLSGLTCTEDNFTTKAGAYGVAAELGVIVVAPDTSPRGDDVPDDDAYDLGKGAGFYLDATNPPWDTHFHMYSYITKELTTAIDENFPADPGRRAIMGHSMGGHGALTIWLKNPDLFRSASAVAPICAPMQCPWGEKAFSAYLGDDRSAWADYDATELMTSRGDGTGRAEILVDQGLGDNFLEGQLHPHLLEEACAGVDQKIAVRRHDGYDHSYFFIATVIGDHLRHHAGILSGT
ncbi:MAG: S-formylglutathione hydrolase [Alphaproteobacteria bacterium]